MLPWAPRQCGPGEEQAPEEQGPSAVSNPGQARDSGEEALGEPRKSPLDSPQPWYLRPSWIQKEQLLPRLPPGLAAEQSLGTPVPPYPQMTWEVAPSRMTLLPPWDPNYEAQAGPRWVQGPSCGSGTSFSDQTLCHPSFWPLYEAAA